MSLSALLRNTPPSYSCKRPSLLQVPDLPLLDSTILPSLESTSTNAVDGEVDEVDGKVEVDEVVVEVVVVVVVVDDGGGVDEDDDKDDGDEA